MVRISESAKAKLEQLAAEARTSQTNIIDEALAAYERRLFYDNLRAAYQELRNDRRAWAEYKQESEIFEGANADGLPREK